ncbi:cell filamentation protein [Psychroflexus salarius]|uniref:protein adenylyltransferase n=1 Tax=Psychroflexus salarius TaxID=1155689 RepID=A0A1M4YED0_9FLAO|nr:Fic family protein [Psychroflexus salarius]SHF04161.1 cell filamentation protein [Psychroflexus salarius]
MSNSYRYVDPDYTYIDPKSGVLKNLADITDSEDLLFFESVTVTKRINELHNNPIKINGIESLFSIHQHLFQDIYDWAGKKRLVEISKDGKQFFPTSHFENAFNFIDTLIESFKKTKRDDRNEIAEKLAEILDNVNYLHPFRDGNGRAQREFLRMLALEKGISLNLNPPDDKNVYKRYMQGTVNSNVKILKELIFELIS